ncbi:MAG: nucleotidyl transferase AbiEii/AbiGii toxin family protein [Chlamydiae bacterium]|nr:nucleotidyl transferase AbiEii/AbiGii toxin family protein [Chlamydiota bacterium]MBI3265852.1 nucleotidyl transferase AbiEii/AbiGii toxin family protein [Chlamydiota bacterium]
MERIKKIVQELRNRPTAITEEALLNIIREYLQVLVLKSIFQSKWGTHLSFMGGTCLRICYDLKRYSEDLDFCLDEPSKAYDFSKMVYHSQYDLGLLGISAEVNIHDDKIVQKAFLRVAHLKEILELKTFRKDQKLHIKLEVDRHPPRLKKEERESFFVNRFQEIFPILKHNLPTLFSGKVLAILQRPYARGRDYYDLIWYLSRKTPVNLNYLNRGYKGEPFKSWQDVLTSLKKKVEEVRSRTLLKDIDRFLEDPQERQWIFQYQNLFRQLIEENPKK